MRAGVACSLAVASTTAGVAAAQDTASARAGVSVRLAYGGRTRPTLLVLPVQSAAGDSVVAILRRDLTNGDRVLLAPPPASAAVDYTAATRAGVAGIVAASLSGGTLRVEMHDAAQRRVALVREFPIGDVTTTPSWRLGVHAAADETERWATGVRGIAATRVLFVRDRRVWIVDSDGAGARALSGAGALSPNWLPAGGGFVYSTLGDDGAQRVVARGYDVARATATGGARTLVEGGVLNLTPTVSPDGRTVAYAHGDEDGTDLNAVPVDGGATRRLTVGRGSDNVSPSYSPDGLRIAFTSGRAGHPEVYIADADGTDPELLTDYAYGARNYRSNPAWSPDGRLVAYQAMLNGRFQLCAIEVRGRAVRCVDTPERTEDPSWAPDSRHLVATATSGAPRLVVVDFETGRTRPLVSGSAARMPAWSPPLR